MPFECYACKNSQYSVLALANQIRFNCYGHEKNVVKCSSCSFVQLYPQWTDEELDHIYDKYSLKMDFSNYKPKIEIRKYIDKLIIGKKRILEVGCGQGHNLRRQIGRGYNIVGIDKDPTVCNGDTILNCSFENFISDVKFDFIYSTHVFEHIKNPSLFIESLRKNLVREGEFSIEVPSIKEPLLSLYKNKSYQGFYWYPFHTYYYNPETIMSLFKRHNIDIKISLIQRYGILNHLRWIIFGKPGNWHPHIPFLDFLYKLFLTKVLKISDTMLIIGKM